MRPETYPAHLKESGLNRFHWFGIAVLLYIAICTWLFFFVTVY